MNKCLFFAISLSVSSLLFSCKPDDTPNTGGNGENTPQERLAEGIYEPDNKISSVAYDGVTEEQWSWADRRLDHVSYEYGSMITCGYNGDYLSTVTSVEDGITMESRFFYNGGFLSNYEIYQDNMLVVSARVTHNASNKISNTVFTISDEYIEMIMGDIVGMKTLSNIVGERVAQSVLRMAKLKALDSDKAELTGTSVVAAYDWEGDNVVEERMSLSVNMTLSAEELSMLETMFGVDVPDAIISLIGSTGLPLQIAMADTMSYTYDDKRNPYCYCWVEGITATTLSCNNPVSVAESGNESIAISMMGQVVPLQESPYESNSTFVYTYNEANCPISVVSNDGSSKTITYN